MSSYDHSSLIVITDEHLTLLKFKRHNKVGTKRNFLETLLSKNKKLKKFIKMLTWYKGTKALERSAFSTTYETVWCAGPSIEGVKSIRPVKQVVSDLIIDFEA